MADQFTSEELFDLIQNRMAEILEIEKNQIQPSSSFSEDLGADSLALIEMVDALESYVRERSPGFFVDDEALEQIKTISDAIDFVLAKVEES